METTVPLNKEEVTNKLKDYVGDNRGMLFTIGFGTTLYLLGRQNGLRSGYIRGYVQNFRDMVRISRDH